MGSNGVVGWQKVVLRIVGMSGNVGNVGENEATTTDPGNTVPATEHHSERQPGDPVQIVAGGASRRSRCWKAGVAARPGGG